jgi:hypothetical protein
MGMVLESSGSSNVLQLRCLQKGGRFGAPVVVSIAPGTCANVPQRAVQAQELGFR